ELNLKLSALAETEKLQKEKQRLSDLLEKTKQSKLMSMAAMLKKFNNNPTTYFAKSLILKSLESLSQANKLDKGIPDMHARTIEFLIKRGFCVCGTKVEFGKDTYNELNKALEYLPPHSIGMLINQFVTESESKVRASNDLFETVTDQYKAIRDYEDSIEKITSDIRTIE